jgi:ribosomal protein L24
MGKRKAYPIHVSNAGLYDKVVKKAVKVRFGFHAETGEKLRISKASGVILKRPVNKYLVR